MSDREMADQGLAMLSPERQQYWEGYQTYLVRSVVPWVGGRRTVAFEAGYAQAIADEKERCGVR